MLKRRWVSQINLFCLFLASLLFLPLAGFAQDASQKEGLSLEHSVARVSRFPLSSVVLAIHQAAHPRNPFSLAGETAAILGRQDGSFELWDFPVKVLAHVHILAELASDPVPIDVNARARKH
jgi:hypothetical protein